MHASFKIVKFPMQRCLVGWQEYALSIYLQIFLYTVTECHTGGIQLFLCISQYFFPLSLQQTNEQQAGYISFQNFTESKSH